MSASEYAAPNAGMARRFHDLAEIEVVGDGARTVIGLVEAQAYALPLRLSLVERHPLGAQAFIPLSAAPFLVVVCPDADGRPGHHRPRGGGRLLRCTAGGTTEQRDWDGGEATWRGWSAPPITTARR